MKVGIVGCGKSKRSYRSKARNLYTSSYFAKKRRYGDVACDKWFVLSAEHGLIDPGRRIDPYDTHIDDVEPGVFDKKVREQAGEYDAFDVADTVVVLAGSKYIDAVGGWLESLPADVEYPFDDTGGIGDQQSKLNEMTPHLSPEDYRREAAYRSPVDVYSASIGAGISLRYNWPFKLISVDNIPNNGEHERIRVSCETLMVDSGIGNEDVGNEDVLDAAHKVDADWVVPKDYLEDHDRTTESVYEFFDLYDDHLCDADVIVPLQPPHHRHVPDLPEADAYAVGGVKDDPVENQLKAVRNARNAVGGDAYLHGFGMGSSRILVDTLRENPALLDSFDVSTPEFAPARHRTPDKSLLQETGGFVLPGGDDTSTGKAIASELILWEISHMLNPDWRGDDSAAVEGVQSDVGAFI